MDITIEPLTADDIPWAMELVELAQWNQLPGDWMRFLEHEPRGCFKACVDGVPVATVTTKSYAADLAWVGMMLVHPELRRRGVGRRLMQHAIDSLRGRGIRSIKLDATPLGRPLYELLGFEVEGQWNRWQRDEGLPNGSLGPPMPPSERVDLPESIRFLDTTAFGVDRWAWLQALAGVSRIDVDTQGYGMLREGRIASYLGPVVSADAAAAESLIERLLAQCTGRCLWDIPPGNEGAVDLAVRHRFKAVRVLYRMSLGETGPTCEPLKQFAICDPATG